ncbi:hypothetical protein [Serinicoccus sediminis]|uniref:hypothetical protein n=1 Tax=Serinicoccus sediminis TaxID=2306021 RepID=UPI0010229BF9|nr:hypothetical protein [Serinicoccus sediminis]
MIRRFVTTSAAFGERTRRWTEEPERGDVPGWVLITIMTAGLVAALWLVAEPLLTGLFSNAVSAVTGP